jgi:fused signal recognition particle receptor
LIARRNGFGYANFCHPDRNGRDGIIPPVSENTWRQALARTHKTTFGQIARLLGAHDIDKAFWEDLEALLIQADVGQTTTRYLITEIQAAVRAEGFTRGEQAKKLLTDNLISLLGQAAFTTSAHKPGVTLLVGVNGSGKTTSAAKLAQWLLDRGDSVLLAAADTYRAAASEQLEVWADRLGINVVTGTPGGDPGAVVYDACQSAIAKAYDHLIVDTSGRMHTEHNLMEELKKINKVCGKVIEGAPHAALLVLDATTGQNGLAQARAFSDAIRLDGTILAKLDGSAKGGIAIAIREMLNLPVLFAGIGEGLEDLEPFEPQLYVQGLMGTD